MKTNSKNTESSMGFRKDIEGLRGVAVFMVVLFHIDQSFLSGGFVGVDIFFVISGYLISGILIEEYNSNGKINFKIFYMRRIRRLFPAAVLTILATLFFASFVLSPYENKEISKTAIFSILSVSNILFSYQKSDYFSDDITNSPLIHTWSLAVEEQFYLFWPIIVLIFVTLCQNKRSLFFSFLALSTVSLIACVIVTDLRAMWAFFITPFRAWEFGAGALAFLFRPQREKTGLRMAWSGLLVIVASGFFLGKGIPFPGSVAMIPVFGTCFLLSGCATAQSCGPGRYLAAAPMQVLGRLSYSWYLWHWPFLTIGPAFFSDSVDLGGRVVLALAALFVAALSYAYVENPIRRHRWLVGHYLKTAALGVVLLGVGSVAAYFFYANAKNDLATPLQKKIEFARKDHPSRECIVGFPDVEPKSCRFGPGGGSAVIVLFGDSHAHQWLSVLSSIAERNNWTLITFLKSSCSSAYLTVYNNKVGRPYHECDTWRQEVIRRILKFRPSLTILTNSSAGYVEPVVGKRGVMASYEDWEKGLDATFSIFSNAALPVVLIRDNPRLDTDPIVCLSRGAAQGRMLTEVCRFERQAVVNAPLHQAEVRAASKYDEVQILDFTENYCSDKICPSYRDGMIVYRDVNHITQTFAFTLGKLVEHKLSSILSDRRIDIGRRPLEPALSK